MPVRIVFIDKDGNTRTLDTIDEKDEITGTLVSIDSPHHEIHKGHNYLVQEGLQLNNNSKEYLITTPDLPKLAHMVIAIEGGQDTLGRFVEGTGKTGGTAIPAINRNRNSSEPATTTVTHTPAGVEGSVDVIFTCQFGIPAAGGGRGGSGGTLPGRNEIILKRNTKYSFTITALSANDNNICMVIDWYEHEQGISR